MCIEQMGEDGFFELARLGVDDECSDEKAEEGSAGPQKSFREVILEKQPARNCMYVRNIKKGFLHSTRKDIDLRIK